MSTINVDNIAEYTTGSGVTIDGVLIKDSQFTAGTWSSTVTYDTSLTDTSPDETTTVTGNYIKIGKLYHCSLPTLNRTSMGGLGADFILSTVSLPATSSSTNNSSNSLYGYNISLRYNNTNNTAGYPVAIIGSSASTASLTFFSTNQSGSGFVEVNGSGGDCNVSFWFIGA
tara:strand:+ start:285 stop:797 length:513 start_codon:yes stop_codon:yes gene_type:complete